MSLEIKGFEFENCFLDVQEKLLLCDGKPVSITPKAFRLLSYLVENPQHLIKREELLEAVWEDSFVEEGNLTFTIRLLRKALGDNPKDPRFIKTASGHGYRFIPEVRRVLVNDKSPDDGQIKTFIPENPPAAFVKTKNRKLFFPFLLVGILLFGVIFAGSWYVRSKNRNNELPVLSIPFSLEKLSTSGNIYHSEISPDGKTVVYVNQIEGKHSLWLRQLESGNNIEIIAPSDEHFGGLAFSPDEGSVYFARAPRNSEKQLDIFRISIFGGIPSKIVSETQGWIGVSPDGSKLSFVRCYYRQEENCSLWIADSADGKNEQKLVSHPSPFRIADNTFSADGKTIVFAVGQSANQSNEFGLIEVNIESGEQREITSEKFFDIKGIAKLGENGDFLITALRVPNRGFRIWRVSAATGKTEQLTNNSEDYSNLSLDKSFTRLVSSQIRSDFNLQIFQMEKPRFKRILAKAESATFSPNGKIIFSSEMSGNMEIWSIEPDGSRRIQLTSDAGDDNTPIVSPDNNWIFFTSNRTGEVQVWRMNADGSSQAQITKAEGGFPVFVSPDKKWVYYINGRNRTLWRAASEGGDEQLVLNKSKSEFAVSPDGLQVAFSEKQDEERILTIFSLADQTPFKIFQIPIKKGLIYQIEWMSDGKSLTYVLTDPKSGNNSLWNQKLDSEKPQKLADFGDEPLFSSSSFSVSPDGKSFITSQGNWRHDAVLLKGLK